MFISSFRWDMSIGFIGDKETPNQNKELINSGQSSQIDCGVEKHPITSACRDPGCHDSCKGEVYLSLIRSYGF